MTTRTLSRSLMVLCLATTSVVAVKANAKTPELSFYSEHKWTVEYVGDSKANRNKICTLSNQLNNGYVLQIAGTEQGFTNLNIDFRQDSFQKNLKYEVKYSVPGLIEKTVPTKAFKESLLVSDLRSSKKLSESLQTASVLDVHIRDSEFRIYMTGLEAAMKDYRACVTKTPAMASASTPVMPKQPGDVKGAMAPAPPLNPSAHVKSSVSTASLAHGSLRPTPSEEPRYTEELAQKLQAQSKKYQPTHAGSTGPSAKRPPAGIIEASMTPPPTKIDGSERIVKAGGAVYNVQKLKPINVDLTNPDNLKVASASSAVSAGSLESSDKKASPNGMNVTRDSEDFAIMRDKIAQLENRVAMLVEKNSMLDEELKNTLRDAEQERLSVSSDNWNLESATMKFNESERQVMRLGRQLQTQRAQCDKEKAELEMMLFDPKLTNQKQLATLASLEAELDEANAELYRQQRQYEERIKILQQQLATQ